MIVLLSIKPEFAERIFDGTKRYEYRKVVFRRSGIDTCVLYVSSPVQMILGEIKIGKVICDNPTALWRRTGHESGVTEEFFFEYFVGRDKGYAIRINSARRYGKPIDPSDVLDDFRVPQSFAYMESEQLLDPIMAAD